MIKSRINYNELNNFFSSIKNEEKFTNYLKNFKSFSESKQGKSGAIVGYIDEDTVMKISTIRYNKNSIIQKDDCLLLKSQINEILINYILTNLEKFTSLDKNELRLKNKYLLKIKDFGLSNNKSYIINKKVGIKIEQKYFTNLNEIILYSHIPKLKNNMLLVNEYQKYMINCLIIPIDKILSLLHQKVKFYHTDFKLKNIFIREEKIRGYQKLKNNNLNLNFVPLISDLDKARLTINKNRILARDDKRVFHYIADKIGYSPLIILRHKCRIVYGKEKCIKFKPEDFDMLTYIINIYIVLYHCKINEYFNILDDYIKERFNLNDDEIVKFKMTIKNNYDSFDVISVFSVTRMSKLFYKSVKN